MCARVSVCVSEAAAVHASVRQFNLSFSDPPTHTHTSLVPFHNGILLVEAVQLSQSPDSSLPPLSLFLPSYQWIDQTSVGVNLYYFAVF